MYDQFYLYGNEVDEVVYDYELFVRVYMVGGVLIVLYSKVKQIYLSMKFEGYLVVMYQNKSDVLNKV